MLSAFLFESLAGRFQFIIIILSLGEDAFKIRFDFGPFLKTQKQGFYYNVHETSN